MNGASDGPLAGWAIVQTNGLTLIGCVGRAKTTRKVLNASGQTLGTQTTDADVLSPVYELRVMMSDNGFGHMVLPVWMMGADSLEVPSGAIVHPCEDLSRQQRVHLLRGVQKAEQMRATMRAEESGLTLATTMPKR